MFTGIVTDMGEVIGLDPRGDQNADLRARIATGYDTHSIDIGASIACEGVCLTVVALGQTPRNWFDVDISRETLRATNIHQWQLGQRLNLERALRVGDELGGHIVSGHVDGVAQVIACTPEGGSLRVTFRAPDAFAKFIAPKGSVALNGTSLTVNDVRGADFDINFIPHTQAVTTWASAKVGDLANLEVDTMARYVARLREWG